MKNKSTVLIIGLLAALLFCFAFALGVCASDTEIYVADGGSGDGSSSTSSLGNLQSALALVSATRNNIVICGDLTVGDTALTTPSDDFTIKSDGTANLVLTGNLEFSHSGATVTLDELLVTVGASDKSIFFGFNSFAIGENVEVSYASQSYTGISLVLGYNIPLGSKENLKQVATYSCSDSASVQIASGTWERFLGGNVRNDDYAPLCTMSGNVDITISGGTFEGKLDDGTHVGKANQVYSAFALTGMNCFTGDVTATISGGSFGGSVFAVSRAGAGIGLTLFDNVANTGDISLEITGGSFTGGEITSMQRDAHSQTLLRGDYNLTLGAGADIADGTLVSAVNVKNYENSAATYARLTNENSAALSVEYFDYINEVAQSADEPIRIAFIGDSITWGYASTDPYNDAYPIQLQAMLDNLTAEYEVGDFGISAAGVLPTTGYDYYTTFAYKTSMEEFDPDYVFIAMGTNDASMTGSSGVQRELFIELYTKLVEDYANLSSCERVYVTTAVDRYTSNTGNDLRASNLVVPLQREICDALSAEYASNDAVNFTLVDLYKLTLLDSLAGDLLGADNLHPDTAGYGLMAEYIYSAFINGAYDVDDSDFYLDTVYVADGGSGDGSSAANPTRSVSAALSRVNRAGGKVVLVGNTTVKGNMLTPTDMTGILTIEGQTGSEKLILGTSTAVLERLQLGGDAIFDKIVLDTSAHTTTPFIMCDFNDLTIGENVSTSAATSKIIILAGRAAYTDSASSYTTNYHDTAETLSSNDDVNITINSGDFRSIIGGHRRINQYSPFGTYGGNMVITINGGSFNAATSDTLPSAACGMNYVSGNIEMRINGGVYSGAVRALERIGSISSPVSYDESANTGVITLSVADRINVSVVERGTTNNEAPSITSVLNCYDTLTGYTASDFDTVNVTHSEYVPSVIEIDSAAELAAIANDLGGDYKLTGDITLTGTWTPLGTFTGTLDGQGHTVSGLSLTPSSGFNGLFSELSGATVENLNLDGTITTSSVASATAIGALAGKSTDASVRNIKSSVDITCTSTTASYVGGIIGWAYTSSGATSEFESLVNYGNLTSGYGRFGGVIGFIATDGTVSGVTVNVTSCANFGRVRCTANNTTGWTGGIAGYARISTTSTVTGVINFSGCANFGEVSTTKQYVGGIVGYVMGKTSAPVNITKCFNIADISAGTQDVGGIAALANGNTHITNCYNSGDVTTTAGGGCAGILGRMAGTPIEITDCYSVGTVTTGGVSTNYGAVVGTYSANCTVTTTYYLSGTKQYAFAYPSGAYTALTAEQLADSESYSGFDFGSTWEMGGNNYEYATLKGVSFECETHTTGDWQLDADNHWKLCSLCDNKVNLAAHTYANGVCTVCGAADPNACAHTSTTLVADTPATCIATGIGHTVCDSCGETIQSGVVIPVDSVNGHNWEKGETIAPTCTAQGYTAYTCSLCSETKRDDYIEATGHVSPLTRVGTNIVCSACGTVIYENINLGDTVFVSDNGGAITGTNYGATAETAVNSLAAAYELLGTEGGTIKIVDKITVAAYGASASAFIEPAHTGKITVTSADAANIGNLAFAGMYHFYMSGETEWNNIEITSKTAAGADYTTGLVIAARGNFVTMGDGLVMTSGAKVNTTYNGTKIYIFAGWQSNSALASQYPSNEENHLVIKSGEYFYIGGFDRQVPNTVSGNATVEILGDIITYYVVAGSTGGTSNFDNAKAKIVISGSPSVNQFLLCNQNAILGDGQIFDVNLYLESGLPTFATILGLNATTKKASNVTAYYNTASADAKTTYDTYFGQSGSDKAAVGNTVGDVAEVGETVSAYEGVSVRYADESTGKTPGMRTMYSVATNEVSQLEAAGYTVEYGFVASLGQNPTLRTSSDGRTVGLTDGNARRAPVYTTAGGRITQSVSSTDSEHIFTAVITSLPAKATYYKHIIILNTYFIVRDAAGKVVSISYKSPAQAATNDAITNEGGVYYYDGTAISKADDMARTYDGTTYYGKSYAYVAAALLASGTLSDSQVAYFNAILDVVR